MFTFLLKEHHYLIKHTLDVSSADSVDLIYQGDFKELANFIETSDDIPQRWKQQLIQDLLLQSSMFAVDLLNNVKNHSKLGSDYVTVLIEEEVLDEFNIRYERKR